MATNKFATMLHKNNHKIIVILVYAVLEWTLISLILLNSLFSSLIDKFAKYFGLKPPCPLCSRSINHIFDSKQHQNSHRNSFCEAHGIEIAKLSYCFTHKRLAESRNLCPSCSSSQHVHGDQKTNETSPLVSFFTRVSENIIAENGEEDHNQYCSCCDEILIRNISPYHPHQLFKDSWDFLEYLKKSASVDLIGEDSTDEISKLEENEDDQKQLMPSSDASSEALFDEDSLSSSSSSDVLYSLRNTSMIYPSNDDLLPCFNKDDESLCIVEKLLMNADYTDSERFICIELIDTATIENQVSSLMHSPEDDGDVHERKEITLLEEAQSLSVAASESSKVDKGGISCSQIEDYNIEDQKEAHRSKELHLDVEFANPTGDNDTSEEKPVIREDAEDKDSSIQWTESKDKANDTGLRETLNPETYDIDEDVEISMIEILHQLDKKMMKYGIEESVKGSIITETEVNDESLMTADRLLPLLRAQEKALKVLYAELEEERKASAIATTETMAMITKLQEEKASIQTEALQFQRMMEEQAEYDQEALQLLNDLLKKREKEKQELEKELEIYHEEKTVMLRSRSFKSTTSSVSSLVDDKFEEQNENNSSDIGLEDMGEVEVGLSSQLEIPEISLAEFDEERLCILEELKSLEAKLLTLPFVENQPSAYSFSSPDVDNKNSDVMKSLLPLFDEECGEQEEGIKDQSKKTPSCVQEEIGLLYERIQAFEADKEFIKQCMYSLMKGNKGLVLLQEILRHLRDLRAVELSYNKCVSEMQRDEGLQVK